MLGRLLERPQGKIICLLSGLPRADSQIKGTHNAMKSGMLAAETAFTQLGAADAEGESETSAPADMSGYETAVQNSWIHKELNEVRNLRPSFHNPLGLWGGILWSGLDSMFLKGRVPWTFRNKVTDADSTKRAR